MMYAKVHFHFVLLLGKAYFPPCLLTHFQRYKCGECGTSLGLVIPQQVCKAQVLDPTCIPYSPITSVHTQVIPQLG